MALSLCLGLGAACAKHEVHPPDHDTEVAAAESVLTVVSFDTVTQKSDAERALHGTVYAYACTKCHGYVGDGNSEYARGRELRVPSLVAPDWKYAGDLAGVRHRVFSGHSAGMPTWGLRGGDVGLSLRDVDAVSFYVVTQLRKDALAR